jgi:hypothetical protein
MTHFLRFATGFVLVVSVALSACGGGGSDSASAPPPSQPPTITAQPQTLTVNAGQLATFAVAATGTAPLSFQWRRNGIDIAGANAPQYQFAAVAGDDGAIFMVVVSNAAGATTSGSASLSVRVPPTIVSQPAASSMLVGQTAVFTVAATGTAPLEYQWLKNGLPITGATASSYTTPALTLADSGALFRVVVSNAAGSETSAPALLSVGRPAPELSLFVGAMDGAGFFDDVGPAARFGSPYGVAIDPSGRIVVVDGGNRLVRRIDTSGAVTTIAGVVGQLARDDGAPGVAKFEFPNAVAVDSSGTAWVLDASCRVRRVTAAGVTTLWVCSPGPFSRRLIAVAPDGNTAYVTDSSAHVVYAINSSGGSAVFAGVAGQAGTADGPVGIGRLSNPSAIALHPDGGLVLAESSGAVRRIAADGSLSTLLGPAPERRQP